MTIDWNKPVRFANKQRIRILRKNPDGTRVIHRLDEPDNMTAVWTVPENGDTGELAKKLGHEIVNYDPAKE